MGLNINGVPSYQICHAISNSVTNCNGISHVMVTLSGNKITHVSTRTNKEIPSFCGRYLGHSNTQLTVLCYGSVMAVGCRLILCLTVMDIIISPATLDFFMAEITRRPKV